MLGYRKRGWTRSAAGSVLIALVTVSSIISHSHATSDRQRQLEELYEQLVSHNHGDTFSPYGPMYYESEAAAAELATMGPEGTRVLLRALRNGEHIPIVTRYLATVEDPRVVPALERQLDTWDGTMAELWVRHALYRLGEDQDEHFAVFEVIMAGDDAAVTGRDNLMFAFARDATRKGQIALIVGRMADEHAVALLERTLEQDPSLLWEVAIGLEYSGDPAATPLLIRMLDEQLDQPAEDVSFDAVQSMIVGIGSCGGDLAIPALRGLVESDRTWLFDPVLRALSRMEEPAAVELLGELALEVEGEEQLAHVAADSIAWNGDPSLVPALVHYIEHGSPARNRAIRSLGRMQQRPDLLEELLGDEEFWARKAAIHALLGLDDEEAGRAVLSRFVETSDGDTLTPLIEMTRENDAQAAERMLAMWPDLDADDRRRVLFTLDITLPPGTDQHLAPALIDALDTPSLVEDGLQLLSHVVMEVDDPRVADSAELKQRLLELDARAAEYRPGARIWGAGEDPGMLLLCLSGAQDAALREEVLERMPESVATGRREGPHPGLLARMSPHRAREVRRAFRTPVRGDRDPGAALLSAPTDEERTCVLDPEQSECEDVSVEIIEGVGLLGLRVGRCTMDDVEEVLAGASAELDTGKKMATARYNEQGLSFTYCRNDPTRRVISLSVTTPFGGRTSRGIELDRSTWQDVKGTYSCKSGYRSTLGEIVWKELDDGTEFHVRAPPLGEDPDPSAPIIRIDLEQPGGILNITCE